MIRTAAILALALLAGIATAAPIPKPKKPVPEERGAPTAALIPGTWVLHWQGGSGVATFHPKGGFTCLWCGSVWIGNWSVEGGRLTVTEAIRPKTADVLPSWFTWAADIVPGTRAGKLANGANFALAPPKPAD